MPTYSNNQPSLAITEAIYLQGVFPPRSALTEGDSDSGITSGNDEYLGSILFFAGNFAPYGTALASGQTMAISQNTALFSLLGTYYGGDGRSTFALPNLRDQMAMGKGQGPGLSDRALAETAGQSFVTLTTSQMPAHGHTLRAGASGLSASPANAALAPPSTGALAYRAGSTTVTMSADSLAPAGSSLPHENRQPYLGLMFCIALQGIFPARS